MQAGMSFEGGIDVGWWEGASRYKLLECQWKQNEFLALPLSNLFHLKQNCNMVMSSMTDGATEDAN